LVNLSFVREEKDGVLFKVKVQPRAARDQVAGIYGDSVKLRLTAPPVDGEANDACRAFIAGLFSVPRARVEIVSGLASRNKLVKVYGVDMKKAAEVFGMRFP